MNQTTGRAGGNIRHLQHRGTKSTGNTRMDRSSLLHESMRELDEEAVKIHANLNPNIVPAESHHNVAMVNNGDATFRPAKSIEEVLDYGDSRISNVHRKWNPNSFETTLIAVHLPKTMCREVPDYYPGLDQVTGKPVFHPETGQPRMRSRWVAKDRDEAIGYFNEVLTYYGSDVLNGGQDAIHGYDINFDESTPHIQIMADTLAPDPKHEGKLRVEAARMWGYHREVTVDKVDEKTGEPVTDKETGRSVQVGEQPDAKMSRYQRGLREHMVAKGYPVERHFDPERHLSGLGKDEYAETMDARRHVEDQSHSLQQHSLALDDDESVLRKNKSRLDEYRDKLIAEDSRLKSSFPIIDAEKDRVAAQKTALDQRAQEITQQEQHVSQSRLEAAADHETIGRSRAALQQQRRELEEREAKIAGQEAVIEDVHTFLDNMQNPAKETLRHRFEQYMELRDQQRQTGEEAAREYAREKKRLASRVPVQSSDHDREFGG